jgi:glyoxylase-like metal-dependent hydrolase (beta-lactamase superfamily II)
VTSPSNRRSFLRIFGAATGMTVAHQALLHPAFADQPDSAPLAVTKLTDTFLLITGAGANVLAVLGSDGVLMVDGGSAEHAEELLKLVAEKSGGKPVQVLFDTSWDPDCTGSNEALGKAGAKIIAHENTKLWLSTEFDSRWRKHTYEPHPKAALPTQTFYAGVQKMTFGGQPVEYGYMMQAHTDGDIYVYFPGPNILMAGGVAGGNCYPILDFDTGGWLGPPDRSDPRYADSPVPTGIVGAQRTLLKVTNATTRIVPAKGPVMMRADLQAESEMLVVVRDRLVKLIHKGYSPSQMVEAKPTQDFDAKYGDPELFIRNAYMGLWGHVHELGGIV